MNPQLARDVSTGMGTGDGGCAGIRLALGVFVLGAADPAERALVRVHLAWCRACREELAGLAGLPGLLRRLPVAEADALLADEAEPAGSAVPLPDSALPQLVGQAAWARRARRRLALAATAVAVVIAAVGGVAGQRALSAASSQIAWTTVSARNGQTLTSATVRYAATGWGTKLEVRVGGIAAGIACQLRVTGSGRQARIAGGWTVIPGQSGVWYPASTSLAAASVRGFSVTAGTKTLVSVPVSSSSRPAAH